MRIYFHNDLDGRCAGAIAYRAAKAEGVKTELIEINYKDNIDIKKIKIGEKIIIVDFSFKPDVMEEVLLLTKNIVWIDHHKTAFEYKYSIELDGLRDNAYSGCELAWKYFYGKKPMPRVVELVGDRDRWSWKFGEDTVHFNMGLLLYDHQPKDLIWSTLLNVDAHIPTAHLRKYIINIKEEGKICLKFRDQFCDDYARSYGFETVFEGYKCFALGLYMFGSEAFGERIKEYDICLSFAYLGNSWIVGLYSTIVDVSKIAIKYGKKYKTSGGGHKFAAGFTAPELPFRKK